MSDKKTDKPKKKRTSRRRKSADLAMRYYFIGIAQQRYSDRKTQLFDDYDYDRISHKGYQELLEEARKEFQAEMKRIEKM